MNTIPATPTPVVEDFVLLGKKRLCPDDTQMKRPYSDYKRDKCLLFEQGMLLCKGTDTLLGYDKKPMNLVVQEEPMAYDDSLREQNGMFAAGVCNDVCPVNVLKCSSRAEMQKNQAMCFAVDDTRYNARVVSVKARYLYITIGVGKEKTTLYSNEYFEAWAEAYSLAGGIVEADMKVFQDMVFENGGHKWIHKDAELWAMIHAKEGLTPDTSIPVYVRHYLARAGDNFAILKKSYGHKSWEISSTSSGLFSMSSANRCYSKGSDMIKDCTGVWSNNIETGQLEMASIKIGASRTRFDAKGIASMTVKTDVVVCDKVEEMSISDDDKTSEETTDELPAADCSLFFFCRQH